MTDEQTRQTQQAQRTQQAPAGGQRVIAGRYTVLGELGRGGMGIVWRAEDRVIGRVVAVKELRLPDVAEEAGVFQERVLREVRTGGSINDPAVVTVYDVVVDHGATYIVMELVEAPTLSDLVRTHGPMPAHQVASIGEQVLAALGAAHQSGIVHRDVKPGNIMVAASGRVKLTDFGIAQAVDDPRLTTSGMLVGSPAFMAPERVAGREAMPASDLWSLGATLFFAVEGIVAHERTSTAATLHAIMNEVPYLTHAQGPLASAIMGLLAVSPEGRLPAEQARGLLQMAAAGQGQSTPPGGNHGPNPTAVHPGRQPNQTMVGGHTMLGAPPMSGPARPSAKGTGRRKLMLAGGALLGVALLAGGFFAGKPFWGPSEDAAMLPSFTYGAFDSDIPALNRTSSYDCGNTPLDSGKSLTDDNWSDCAKTHTFEIFADIVAVGDESPSSSADPKPLTEYPGEEQLKAFAEAKCALVFNSSVVPADQRAKLSYRALAPAQALWEKQPAEDYGGELNRRVLCVLQDSTGAPLTGPIAQDTT
ncbi:serine/threonine protein kinase [Amycolatopsis antarctica]|uniref:non-specific serine/threonine protein kinase n=1 Tax=Amycolatopsis antarctica TaxID=1854586 RepID=A0A263DAJ6_9PSEU|nr:serine/threonine-protein kinase [Amycolatopsis antarctica]OZM74405.1 serine/threonine protein kinase [Amycolatopsis antarctica]